MSQLQNGGFQGSAIDLANVQVMIPEIWSNEVRKFRDAKFYLKSAASVIPFEGKKGDTIRMPNIARMSVYDKLPQAPVNLQARTESDFTFMVTKYKESLAVQALLPRIRPLVKKLNCMLEHPQTPLTNKVKLMEVKNDDKVEDNQQVTSIELAWLAGFVDGEGHIAIMRIPKKNRQGFTFAPIIRIANTNAQAISKIVEIYDKLGASSHIVSIESKTNNHKDKYYLQTQNMASCKIILDALLPHLFVKSAQAKIVLRFVNRRKALAVAEPNRKLRPYTEDDHNDFVSSRVLNKTGKEGTPETIRLALGYDSQ